MAGVRASPASVLVKKGKSGVLKSVETRKEFLVDTGHRIGFVYVPKHTSWLSQIEIWFSILVRRVIMTRPTEDGPAIVPLAQEAGEALSRWRWVEP